MHQFRDVSYYDLVMAGHLGIIIFQKLCSLSWKTNTGQLNTPSGKMTELKN